MATLEQEQQQRDNLQNVLKGLSDFTTTELTREELGSDLNFKNGILFFDRILRLFRGLKVSELEDVPFAPLSSLVQMAQTAFNILQEVRDFSVSKYPNSPLGQRDAIINRARDQYEQMYNAVAPVLAFTVRKGTDFERLENDARGFVAHIKETATSTEKSMQDTVKQAQEALAQVRSVAQEAGVSQHAIHFKNEADLNEKSAKPWLTATSTLAVLTLGIGVFLIVEYLYKVPTLTPSQSVQVAIPKLFVFSVLLSATVWCGKTYRAYRHNAVVNRHRQNALATFQTFAKAAGDQAIKDAVLLQATQCIFSQQPTGYIQSEPEPTALPFSEMMRAVNK